MIKVAFICFTLVIFSFQSLVFGQFGFVYDDTIVVKIGSDTLSKAWAGGLNYPQFSDIDYDFDGDLDLFAFDRSHDNIRVFTQETDGGKHYELAYNSHENFPSDLRYRVVLVDYDNDGRKDIFTYGIGGLKVYRNVGDGTNGLQWELYQDLVYSQYAVSYSNLYISSSDIPAIVDVDGDGDIDILTFHQGGRHIEYHQNQSMDLYGIPDSLIFEQKNQCWGKFTEDANTNNITLNDPNAPCIGGDITNPEMDDGLDTKNGNNHSGSTLLAIDYDNSGVMDLVIGDVSYTNLNLLINSGTAVNTDSPMISVDNSFPSNTTPSSMQLFPAAYYLDVDFDNEKDLLVCPNAKNVSENETSVLMYKNLGTTSNPNFIYTTNKFLQSEMIDLGTGTTPSFFDYDEDGLEDMILGNFYRYKAVLDKESSIAYYKNTGTANNPIFMFVDYDIFNIVPENFGLRAVPTFGDIDNDGDDDLFVGTENGSLAYYQNNSTGSGAVFGSPAINYQDNLGAIISTSGYCYPQLFDLNNDGLLDLLLGRKSGEIMYYKNIGTLSAPSFELNNSNLGNVDVSSATPDGYAAPHFFRLNNETTLFMGSVDGKLLYYSDIDANIGPGDSFTLISSSFLDIDVKAYSSFWVNDINSDGNLDLFVGQDLGGVFHFEADSTNDLSVQSKHLTSLIAIYPNPTRNELTIVLNSSKGENYTITDLSGKHLIQGELDSSKTKLDVSTLPKGFYTVRIVLSDGTIHYKKIIKQ